MSGLAETDLEIKVILQGTKTIALVGASDKVDRPSHRVMRFLIEKGYKVYPVNPNLSGQKIHGQKVYASLSEIPDSVDMVDIFRKPQAVLAIVENAIKIGVKTVWMQLGVINPEATHRASEAGLNVVMNRCPAIEIPKLNL